MTFPPVDFAATLCCHLMRKASCVQGMQAPGRKVCWGKFGKAQLGGFQVDLHNVVAAAAHLSWGAVAQHCIL